MNNDEITPTKKINKCALTLSTINVLITQLQRWSISQCVDKKYGIHSLCVVLLTKHFFVPPYAEGEE